MSVDQSRRGFAENTALVLVAELAVQGTRAVTIFVLAGVLGTEEFGRYAGTLALITILDPLSKWGMNHVGVRAIAIGIPFAETWAKVTTTIAFGGLVGTLAAAGIGSLLLDVGSDVIIVFGLAQLLGFGTAAAATMAAEAHHRSAVSLRINVVGGLVRLSLLGLYVGLGFDTLRSWSWFLLVGMTFWGGYAASQVTRAFDGSHGLRAPSRSDLRHGLGFVFVQTSSSGQTDVDKIVLNAYGLERDAGVYSPGYRITELATVPLIALVRATYAEFFRRGSTTIRAALGFARGLTTVATAYGVAAGVVLWITAPLITVVLGEEYADTVEVIRWLSFIPVVKGLQYFPGNALTGIDRQATRTWIIIVTALVNLTGNVLFVPDYGWKAAAVTTLVSELLFAALLWTAIVVAAKAEDRSTVEDQVLPDS